MSQINLSDIFWFHNTVIYLFIFKLQQLWEKLKEEKMWVCWVCVIFFSYIKINPCSCWSAVDCRIEEAPDRSIIVEGLQQQGDRSLAWKHVAQKADKWNLIQTWLCCVRQTDMHELIFFQSLHLLFVVFWPPILQIFECWLSSCRKSETSKAKGICCAFSPLPPYCSIKGFPRMSG